MLNEKNTNIERIIAKIDNDFNPDNSDWIPRVGAWCIDAMSQIDCLPSKTVKKRIDVKNRIAYIKTELPNDVKVYDCNGCRIANVEQVESDCHCTTSPTGDLVNTELSNTMSQVQNPAGQEEIVVAKQIEGVYPRKHEVKSIKFNGAKRNFVLIKNIASSQIELNFDTDCIIVEYDGIETECSEQYGCELPVIPNNGTLIEAIVYYCMYKMLCRGYKHQVFNLAASQYGTNPYYIWTQLKQQAKRSIINDGFEDNSDNIWRSAMFIHMFDPRR